MALFLIYLDEPTDEVRAALKAKWPEGYQHDDHLYFFMADDKALTNDLMKEADIGEEGGITGIVAQAEYLVGYSDGTLAEWLRKNS